MKEVIVFMKTEAVNEPKLYGYARVSTFQQKEDRQIIALKSIGVLDKNIYVDKQTGKDFNRPQYKKLLRKLDASSVLVIKSLDRLGRNYHELSEQWRIITKEKRSDIVVIDVPLLDTRREKNLLGTLISDLILSLLSYCSDNEYRIIHQRQAEGIAAAKAKGIKFGVRLNLCRRISMLLLLFGAKNLFQLKRQLNYAVCQHLVLGIKLRIIRYKKVSVTY